MIGTNRIYSIKQALTSDLLRNSSVMCDAIAVKAALEDICQVTAQNPTEESITIARNIFRFSRDISLISWEFADELFSFLEYLENHMES